MRQFTLSWRGYHLPTFIVTHSVPTRWAGPNSPFTFVTDGVESALAQAAHAAAGRNIGVGGTTIVQQCLKLGLLDELAIDIAPILLGSGIRLFDNLDGQPIDLECYLVIAPGPITHLRYRVVK